MLWSLSRAPAPNLGGFGSPPLRLWGRSDPPLLLFGVLCAFFGNGDCPQGPLLGVLARGSGVWGGFGVAGVGVGVPALQVLGDQVGFVVLGQVVGAHEAFLALRALEAFVTCGGTRRGHSGGLPAQGTALKGSDTPRTCPHPIPRTPLSPQNPPKSSSPSNPKIIHGGPKLFWWFLGCDTLRTCP